MLSRFNANPSSAIYETSDGPFVLYDEYKELEARFKAFESKVANYRHSNFMLKKKIDSLEKKLKGLE